MAVRRALRGRELRPIVEICGANRAWQQMLESAPRAWRSERVVCEVEGETLGWCCDGEVVGVAVRMLTATKDSIGLSPCIHKSNWRSPPRPTGTSSRVLLALPVLQYLSIVDGMLINKKR